MKYEGAIMLDILGLIAMIYIARLAYKEYKDSDHVESFLD